jgi:hypothetical protein
MLHGKLQEKQVYKIYVPEKGFVQFTTGDGWMCGSYEQATDLPLLNALAEKVHHNFPAATMLVPTNLHDMAPGDLMAMAGLMMTAATTQAQTAIAPMPGSGGGKTIVSMTYPPRYEEAP